jgi:flagellar biosynthesis component FlhA
MRSLAAWYASVWALVLSWLPFVTGTLQLAILIFGVGAGYWAWRANRARAKQLERLDSMGIQPRQNNTNNRNNQHRDDSGFGERDNSEY